MVMLIVEPFLCGDKDNMHKLKGLVDDMGGIVIDD
jgi:hypothetical protein